MLKNYNRDTGKTGRLITKYFCDMCDQRVDHVLKDFFDEYIFSGKDITKKALQKAPQSIRIR